MGSEGTELEVPVNAVGRRVSCDGERATVRYVGPVPPTSGRIYDDAYLFIPRLAIHASTLTI